MNRTRYPLLPVLIVDDEPPALGSCERVLLSAGMNHVLCCQDSREVMGLCSGQEIGVMLLDLSMPYLSGQELLPRMVEAYPDVPVIIVTGANEVETAVGCMRMGAFDYMVKPVERSRMLSGVGRAIEVRELRLENSLLRRHMLSDTLASPEAFSEIVTNNASMQAIFRYAEAIAETPRPVLITGETGVGKELIAKAIHVLSGRTGQFVAVNAAGLDDSMFADTLFGHVRGAFTGAEEARRGLIEQAAKGTLFLDEVGELSTASQVKLLRLVQEHEYFPLGADIPKRTDARLIVATNRDLDALRASDRFRNDLYHRLQTHHVHVPPLRDRRDDIPLLVDHFLERAALTLGKKKPVPPGELLTLLATYDFPGNLRELESMVFDAVSKHESRMLSMDMFKTRIDRRRSAEPGGSIPPTEEKGASPFCLYRRLPTLKEGVRLLIDEAMRRADGNQTVAARLLGISRTALNKRLGSGRK